MVVFLSYVRVFIYTHKLARAITLYVHLTNRHSDNSLTWFGLRDSNYKSNGVIGD